ncbi:MAG: ABC transporter permease [Ignavibacteria bacterium]|nr:ABC transporter permease [Ignavibacteria bacterium]
MKLYNISLQSLRRRKAKTIFLIIGLILSVASVVMLLTVSKNVNASIAANLDEFGANIIITPKTDDISINYAGMSINSVSYNNKELHTNDVEKIRTIKNKDNISIVAPKLLSVEIVNNKNVLITGIRFNDEMKLKKWWNVNGKIPSEVNEVLIGSEVKKKLGIKLNRQLKIRDKDFIVSGILDATGSSEDGMIFMDINESQILLDKKDKVSLIEVAALCYDCPIEEIVRQTSSVLPGANVTPIKQTIESKMTAMHRFEHFSFGISAVILIISMLIVFTNVNASVTERTKEIGIFLAIGFRRSHIMQIILLEVITASLLAGLIGYVIGSLASRFIVPVLTMDESIRIVYDYSLPLLSVGFSLAIGFVASIYPAVRATRLDPISAFRSL